MTSMRLILLVLDLNSVDFSYQVTGPARKNAGPGPWTSGIFDPWSYRIFISLLLAERLCGGEKCCLVWLPVLSEPKHDPVKLQIIEEGPAVFLRWRTSSNDDRVCDQVRRC